MAMADSSNPFAQFSEGMNSGVTWAQNQTHLDLQRQQVQQQQQQFQEMQRQFNVKVGSQLFDEMGQIALQPPGEVKNERIKALQGFAQQSGINMDPTWFAALKDQSYQPKWSDLVQGFNGMKVDNPAAFDDAMSRYSTAFGQPATLGLFEKYAQGIQMVRAAKIRADASTQNAQTSADARMYGADQSLKATANRIDAGYIKNAQGTYDKQVFKPTAFVLDSASRALDLINKIQDPNTPDDEKVKANKQVRTLIAGEEARLFTQKSNFGEGTQGAMAVDTWATRFGDLAQKVTNEPTDTLSDDFLNQAKTLYSGFSQSFMEAHDRQASTLLGGSTDAQKQAVTGRAKAFQKQYGKKFGKWSGPGLDTGDDAGGTAGGGSSSVGTGADGTGAGSAAASGTPASGAGAAPSPSAASQAPASPTPTPAKAQAAQKLRQLYQQAKPGPEKAALAQKIQGAFSPQERQFWGLP